MKVRKMFSKGHDQISDLFKFAKDKIANLKLRETVLLTLGTLSRKTSDIRVKLNSYYEYLLYKYLSILY